MANDVINIFDVNPRAAMNKVRGQYISRFSEDMIRAAEIAEEEYNDFLGDAGELGVTGILREADVVVKKVRKTRNIDRRIIVGVPSSGNNTANIIFHVLDEGREALGEASKYGIKAWPMAFPRQESSGNIPLSHGGSSDIQAAFSGEEVVFRPVIYNPILPRHFTDRIRDRIEKRLIEEGLGYIRVDVDTEGL